MRTKPALVAENVEKLHISTIVNTEWIKYTFVLISATLDYVSGVKFFI